MEGKSQEDLCLLSKTTSSINKQEEEEEEETQEEVYKIIMKQNSSSKKKKQVLLEGYVGSKIENNTNELDDLNRTKSLTDDDLDELKGCLDLGFGFSYDEIPELCNTLPALELCYSMSQKFLDNNNNNSNNNNNNNNNNNGNSISSDDQGVSDLASSASTPSVANWKFSSPGDHPDDVKARLKFWAQAVACTVKLCN